MGQSQTISATNTGLSHRIYCGIDYAAISDVLTGLWMDIWDTYLTNPIQLKNIVLHEKRVP